MDKITKIGLTGELVCRDIKDTVLFYTEILRFSKIDETDDWIKLSFGQNDLMFITKKEISKDVEDLSCYPIGGSFVLLIEISGIREYFEKIKKKVVVVKELYRTDYGTTEFVIKDNNGYYLMYSQRDET